MSEPFVAKLVHEPISPFRPGRRLCFLLLLGFCSLASAALLETDTEQLDPVDLLTARQASDRGDANPAPAELLFAEIKPAQPQHAPTAEPAGTNFAAQLAGQLPTERISSVPVLDNILKRQIWQSNIAAPAAQPADTNTNRLAGLIEQISSVSFHQPQQTAQPAIVIEPTTEPAQSTHLADSFQQPQQQQALLKPPYESVTDKTLNILNTLFADANLINNPFELAEILFQSGKSKEAAAFYQQALNRITSNDPNNTPHRSWVLFQLGNCLRDNDPQTARKIYTQLITEYPDSHWANVAKAHISLIDWYLQDNPKALIEEAKR